MKQYQKLFIGLSLLTFISCGSSGGGGHDNATNVTPKAPINGEVLKKGEISTAPIVAGSGETQISNGNTKIDDKTKVAVMAENGGKITNGTDAIISGIFAVGIEASGTGSEVTNDGKVIGGSNEDIARSVVPSYNQEINTIGMEALNGGQAINNGEISGKLSEGIVADGKGSTAINNGEVSSTGVKYNDIYTEKGITYDETGIWAAGMQSSNGGSIVNSEDGIISGTITEGMRAVGTGSTAINNGNINSSGTEESGIYVDEDGIERTYSGIYSKGMRAKNGAFVTNNGNISGVVSEGMRAQGTGSTAINNGNISSTGSEYINLYTDENGVKHVSSGTFGKGMRAKEGASIINGENGTISGTISDGMSAQGEGSTAANRGEISSTGTENINTYIGEDGKKHINSKANGGRGMRAREGATIANEKTGTISGTLRQGMYAEGKESSAVNNGKINLLEMKYTDTYTDKDGIVHSSPKTNGGIGMEAREGATITNGKIGTISGNIETGMYADGKESSAVNDGSISSSGINWTSTYTDENGITQTSLIISGETGMETDGGSIINNGSISGAIEEGMYADEKGSTGVNNGSISSSGVKWTNTYTGKDGREETYKGINGATGMKTYDGSIINNGNIFGTIEEGMGAYGEGSEALNNGEISFDKFINKNTYVNMDGTIKVDESMKGTAMHAYNGATVINGESGVISGALVTGMSAESTGYDENGQSTSMKSIAKNFGTININGENGIGMKALSGATAINEETGIINLNGSNGIGMYATGEKSTIENRGKIYLSGSEVIFSSDSQTAEDIATNVEMINGKDSKGNIGMKIDSGARMINKGHIVFGK